VQRKNHLKYVDPLSEQDIKRLNHTYRTHLNHRVRQRSHAILLSHRGYKIPDISQLLESHRDRVSAWIDQWHREGIEGLYDQPRSGRPMIYTPEELDYFKQALDKQPQQIGLAQSDLESFTGKCSSQNTLKRALKKVLDTAGSDVADR